MTGANVHDLPRRAQQEARWTAGHGGTQRCHQRGSEAGMEEVTPVHGWDFGPDRRRLGGEGKTEQNHTKKTIEKC